MGQFIPSIPRTPLSHELIKNFYLAASTVHFSAPILPLIYLSSPVYLARIPSFSFFFLYVFHVICYRFSPKKKHRASMCFQLLIRVSEVNESSHIWVAFWHVKISVIFSYQSFNTLLKYLGRLLKSFGNCLNVFDGS